MKIIQNNKKGVALLTVVLYFLVLVILLSGLLFATVSNLGNSQTTQKHTSVFYAAESGINLQVSKFIDLFEQAKSNKWTVGVLKNKIALLVDEINDVDHTVTFKDNLGNDVTAEITISSPFTDPSFPAYTFYSITSVGNIDGVSRTLTTNLGFEYVVGTGPLMPISGAIIVNSSIDVENKNSSIVGSIASNMLNGGTIDFKSGFDCSKIPAITVPQGTTIPSGCKYSKLENQIVFSEIVLPEYPSSSLLSSKYININANPSTYLTTTKLTLPNPGTKEGYYITNLTPTGNFTIDLGNWADEQEIVTLRVTGSMSFNSSYTVTGKGKLMILLDHTSDLTISGNVNSTLTDPTKFLLILKSNSSNPEIRIANNTTFVGSILSDSNHDVVWLKAKFLGFLATNAGYTDGDGDADDYDGLVSISANTTMGAGTEPPIWIYAPHANVNLQGGGKFYGTVMGYSFTMNSAQTTLEYKASTTGYPFSDWTILPGIPNGELAPTDIDYRITPIKEN